MDRNLAGDGGWSERTTKNRSREPSLGSPFVARRCPFSGVLICLIRNQTDQRQLIATPHERGFNVELTQPARICPESNKAKCKQESLRWSTLLEDGVTPFFRFFRPERYTCSEYAKPFMRGGFFFFREVRV